MKRGRSSSRSSRRPASAAGTWFLWSAVALLSGGITWLWLNHPSLPEDSPSSPIPTPFETPAPRGPSPASEPPVVPGSFRSGTSTSVPPAPRVPAPSRGSNLAIHLNPPAQLDLLPPTPAGVIATNPPPDRLPGSSPGGSGKALSVDQIVAAQLAMASRGISSGPIDGVIGSQTRAAVRVFQRLEGLKVTGDLDPPTLARLHLPVGGYTDYVVTTLDLARLTPVPRSWLGKSSRERLDYETILELIAEKSSAHPRLIRQLNPRIDWHNVPAGTVVRVPATALPAPRGRAAFVVIRLGEKTLAAYDANSNLLAHFPCSIARRVEKRPVGELRVVKLAPNPNYRFDPEIFSESEEARRIGRKLMIPPGPNNPVGTAWIGLNRPGYGIHGTPHPEEVGRTESRGCFRLANWNAEYLLRLAWVGMPVRVEP